LVVWISSVSKSPRGVFSFTIVVSAPTTMTSDLLEELNGGGKEVTDSSSSSSTSSLSTLALGEVEEIVSLASSSMSMISRSSFLI
jgi:hypothetical protein